MAQKMERDMQDPHLSSLRAELGLLDIRMEDLLTKLPEQHTKETWQAVRGRIESALESLDDPVALTESPDGFDEIRQFLDAAISDLDLIRSDSETWKDIVDLIAERRRTAESEQKREIKLEGTVTAAQFELVTGALGLAVNEEIGGYECLTSKEAEELITRIGARFAHALKYPILEPGTDPMTPLLEARSNRPLPSVDE